MSSPTPEPRSGPPPGGPPGHPLAGFAPALVDRLGQLTGPAARPVWALTLAEAPQVAVNLSTAISVLCAIRLQVVAEVDRNDSMGAETSAAEWLAAETRQRRSAARADLKLARSLGEHPRVEAGMLAGVVNPDQAAVIVRALDRLPTTGEFAVDADQRDAAEVHLVKLAAVHGAQALEVLGRRVFEVIAPDLAEA